VLICRKCLVGMRQVQEPEWKRTCMARMWCAGSMQGEWVCSKRAKGNKWLSSFAAQLPGGDVMLDI